MTTYYMRADGTAANKAAASGPGTSQSACMNVSVHNGETFSAGDIIKICDNGGIYYSQIVPPSAGSAGNLITYEPETGDTPEINGSTELVGASWADQGGNVWSTSVTTEPHIVFLNDVKGNHEATQGAVNAANDWFWGSNVLYIYSTSNPSVAFSSIEAAITSYVFSISSKNYVRLANLSIWKGKYDNLQVVTSDGCEFDTLAVSYANVNGISLRGCDNCSITNGHYHNNGTLAGDPNYAENTGAGILLWDGSQTNTIDGVESDNNAEDGVALGGPIGFYSGADNVVNNCNLHDNLEDGVDIKNGNQTISGCVINDNVASGIVLHATAGVCTVVGSSFDNNGPSHFLVTDVDSGCTFEASRCVFYPGGENNATVHLTYNNGPHKFHYCVFSDGSIYRQLQIQGGSGHEVHNCTFYCPNGGTTSLLRFTTSAASVLVKNNVFVSSDVPLIRYDTGVTVAEAENNSYYRSDGTASWLDYQGTFYSKTQIDDGTVFAAKGTDGDSITGDPLMIDPANDNFHLQSGSPCINAGVAVGLTQDYDGSHVPMGSAPDIGAFEFISEWFQSFRN